MRLLEPNKTIFFLDRGFRDIFKKLITEYHFEPKIPHCQQLEDGDEDEDTQVLKVKTNKQLTTKNTTDTRLVTKIRFQIERSNGFLKNNYAFDYIRNSQVGHIQIDYRIACAMSNFVHKPSYTDIPNTEEVALRIKIKAQENQENKLEFLINKRLGTSFYQRIDITSINDFVKLNLEDLKKIIFLGSYQLKMSKSYLIDLLKHNVTYLLDKKILKQKPNNDLHKNIRSDFGETNSKTKIIAVELLSRHRRGLLKSKDFCEKDKFRNVYKVFIHYVSQLESVSDIENKDEKKIKEKPILAWICSCKSGRRIVGCCSHVATVIYYLSWAKYHTLKFPAEHLNLMFIDKSKLESANQPKYSFCFYYLLLHLKFFLS
jgi:hypothetical protein